jgi:hypothetical protein
MSEGIKKKRKKEKFRLTISTIPVNRLLFRDGNGFFSLLIPRSSQLTRRKDISAKIWGITGISPPKTSA